MWKRRPVPDDQTILWVGLEEGPELFDRDQLGRVIFHYASRDGPYGDRFPPKPSPG